MAGFSKKKYFKLAKGYYGRAKNCFRITVPKVQKSLARAYVGRKLRPRTLRMEWIMAISATTKDLGINYSRFIEALNNSNIKLNRKILADMAMNEPYSFKAVVDEVRLQQGHTEYKRKYTLQQMIRRNMLTAARLEKEDYLTMDLPGFKLRSIGTGAQTIETSLKKPKAQPQK